MLDALRRNLASFLLFESDRMYRVAALALGLLARIGGRQRAVHALERFGARFVWSGWPHRTPGIVNVSASALFWRLRRDLEDDRPRPSVRRRGIAVAAGRPLRVGCLAPFAGLLTFPPEFFAAVPAGISVSVYDVEYNGQFAGYLKSLVGRYHALGSVDGGNVIDQAARRINDDRLDVLYNISRKRDAYQILDRVDTPCIVNICTGSDLLHHQLVDVQLYVQPEADFFPMGDRLLSAWSGRPIGDHRVERGWMLYDRRGILSGNPPASFASREPLIVCHGSLYKMNAPAWLDVIFALLRDDARLEFVFMGKRGADLEAILNRARRAGVEARVHYMGSFSHVRAADGGVHDSGWDTLCGLLSRARLAPDPWPVGGGSSRVEAYLLGAPSVHMGLRTDPASWRRPQPALVDLPALSVEEATAYSPAGYQRLCERALRDESFADDIARKQHDIARRVTDPAAYWNQLIACYEGWRARAPAVLTA